MTAPAISVVVATRDRPAALERCLTALAWQSALGMEVVVVDDGSLRADAVVSVVARTIESSERHDRGAFAARIVPGEGRGPAAARNLGARSAGGAVICFTDDDCVPGPLWAQRLATACGASEAAAGTTVAGPQAGRAAAASQLITRTLQVVSLQGDRLGFAPTCNLACRADIARALPFDERFPLAAGEDRDWCARLTDTGAHLQFVPEAVVEHLPPIGLAGLARQQARYGRGAVRFRSAGEGRRLSGRTFYRRLARDAVAAGPAVAALVVVAQVAVAAGAAREAAGGR